jgi:tetratricopeptide (TPR) repeat protein
VSNRCPRPLAALAAIVYLSIPCSAQTNEVPSVKGEVHSDTPVNFRDYRVELEDLNRHGEIYHAELRLDGEFEMRHITAGEYQLRLTTLHGDVVQQDFVTVNSLVPIINVYFRTGRKPTSAPGTVSITQLRHPPDRKAIQSFAAAQRFAASGNPEKAAAELQKAVTISPEFADAYTNLAVQHMRMQRFPEAAEEMQRAIAIAGPNAMRLCNLAYAQINLGRLQEALVSARAALRLDSDSAQGHLILGSLLAGNRRTLPEAITHLERAAETMPSARAVLERAQNALQAPQPN